MIISQFDKCNNTREQIRDEILWDDATEENTLAEADDSVEGFWETAVQGILKHEMPAGFSPDWNPKYTDQTTYGEIIDDMWNELQKFKAKLDELRNETDDVKALLNLFKWMEFTAINLAGQAASGRKCWNRKELKRKMLEKIISHHNLVGTQFDIRHLTYNWMMAIHGMDIEWLTRVQQRMQKEGKPGIEWSDRQMFDSRDIIEAVDDLTGLAELVGKIRHKATDPENIRLV